MKISKITIENFKSFKSLEFTPNEGLNAFIGANSTGKSNLFDAVNWVLGHTYPSFNALKKEDRFLGDEANKIKIRLDFDDGNYLELAEEWTDNSGRIKSGLNFNGGYCTSETREKYCCAYLDVERRIFEYLPSNRWSLVGRILQEINKKFLTETMPYKGETKAKSEWLKEWLTYVRDKLLFTVQDESGNDVMKKFMDILQEESARQLNKPQSDFFVDLSLYDPWNYYKTLQLIVKESDMGMTFPASSLGMGVQASISVAILKAYSELNLANKSPIFIDEPELFLHPQAQKNFYKILRELSEDKFDVRGNLIREGTQIFYTTHSPNFLSAGNFDEIFIVRKTKSKGTYFNLGDTNKFLTDLKIRKGVNSNSEYLLDHYMNAYENTGDSQKANEGFFAKKIILVEGQSEALLMPYYFGIIGFDYIKEGISIVRCGGKTEIDRFYRLYVEFGIPCYVIFDGDMQLKGSKEEKDNIAKNKEVLSLFGDENLDYPDDNVKDKYLGFQTTFEDNISYTSSSKGLELFIEVKNATKAGKLNVPKWVTDVQKKVLELSEENVLSILKS